MKIEAGNNSLNVRTNTNSPRCIEVTAHLNRRPVVTGARYWNARPRSHKHGPMDAYISFNLIGFELPHESSQEDRDKGRKPAAVNSFTFLDVSDAIALRDALTAAIEKDAVAADKKE